MLSCLFSGSLTLNGVLDTPSSKLPFTFTQVFDFTVITPLIDTTYYCSSILSTNLANTPHTTVGDRRRLRMIGHIRENERPDTVTAAVYFGEPCCMLRSSYCYCYY